jgi:phospholipase/carboxylesterase
MLRRPALLALAFALGCGLEAKPAPPSPGPAASAAPPVRALATEAAGVRFLERMTAGAAAGDKAPLIVAIHGFGDRPESFVRLFDGFPVPARLIVPYGEPYGEGFSWFPIGARLDPDALAAGITQAAHRLAPMISALVEARPTAGKPIVTGFSQGGMLSFALAVLHPEVVGEAFPVSGVLPSPLWPSSWPMGKASPPIQAFHGDADSRVPVADDRQGVDKLRALGMPVLLHEYPGVGHTVSAEMRRDLHAALADALSRAAR